jgi:RimJ/RimL family protein N-acetyltransferase
VVPDLSDGELALRAPAPADVDQITRICADPEIQLWTRVPSPYTTDDARRFVLMAIGALAEGTGAHLLAVDAVDRRRVLGCVGLSIEAADRSAELGYWVAPDARGRGVATRAGRLLLRYAFDHLGIGAVVLQAGLENAGSNAVARALGFQPVGVLRSSMIAGASGDADAPRRDARLYDLVPGELT